TPRPAASPAPKPSTPSDTETRAIPVPANGDPADPTAAIPVPGNDSDATTEKLNAHGKAENGEDPRPRRRAGGGLSAQDLLRREGSL
ncbi:MAG TPA: hypothetical protein VGC05_01695, partial [Mycobacterium sp.]